MQSTIFNPAQLQMLSMFRYSKSEEELNDLKSVLLSHYASQMQAMADAMWDNGTLGEQAIDNILKEHLRTPYQQI